MAELLYSRYIPIQKVIVKDKEKTVDDFKKEGYDIVLRGAVNDYIYKLSKPPILEMVFRQGERDYVFDMIKEARRFFNKDNISVAEADKFAILIAYGDIKVTILPDGTYTLK